MALTGGTRIGPYQIESLLGVGGMGEVYRATDTKLGWQVALKILPDAFARDPERVGRFAREAQVLASLNHPNIAGIYGFEDSSGAHALVMELVEGLTLADCIIRSDGAAAADLRDGSEGRKAAGFGAVRLYRGCRRQGWKADRGTEFLCESGGVRLGDAEAASNPGR
jgi:hypothetical protein